MRVLALDTSSRAGSAAVVHDDRVIVERAGDAARSHAERVPGELLDVLGAASLTPRDIDLYAVASGPGSFTGLRIGIAAMQGMALVNGRPLLAVSALEALAASAWLRHPDARRIGVWMDAYRGDVFSALYETRHGGDLGDLIERESPIVEPPVQVWARWLAIGAPDRLTGDGAGVYAAVHGGLDVVATRPIASVIARLAARRVGGGTHHPAAVQPLYVRRPDAVVAREAREGETRQASEPRGR